MGDIAWFDVAQDRTGGGENGNDPSGYIKFVEFLDCLTNYWLIKKDC